MSNVHRLRTSDRIFFITTNLNQGDRPFRDVEYEIILETVSSLKVNRLRKTRGSRWQHQFWDRFVRHSKEFAERLEYMHYNPVRKGLVEHPEQWRWSSANNFSLDKTVVAACPIRTDYVQLPDDYRA